MENKYDAKVSEKKWQEFWSDNKIFKTPNKTDFSIDTPPPTVSGNMHMGHACSYAHEDFIARFQRMKGKKIFYPFGTDDNGLPTEKLVEKIKKVSSVKMSRKDFRELCYSTISALKEDFIQDWINLGMSCDFENSYSTISSDSIKASQQSFIDLYNKGRIYREEAPVSWCPKCQTAIAQAEFENVDMNSQFSDIAFDCGGHQLVISTTRPELIPACVALFANPADKRFAKLKNKFARVPLFNYEVPILFDESVNLDKGTGLMMVCTFGDKEDVEKWRKHNLELRNVINKDGKLNSLANEFANLSIIEARKKIIDSLKEKQLLLKQINISHAVNVHDKCGTEVEYLKTSQWFIKLLDKKHELIAAGNKINWYPEHMKTRYVHWVENLNWDWCISRQRHFGVPFPLWYDSKGQVVLATKLPADPETDTPEGFTAELDVMDTWATSSVSPQIIQGWPDKKLDLPMTLRDHAHDIIRTWTFYTIAKSLLMHNSIPWDNLMISGFVLDPKGKKMSKSLGNVIEPRKVLEKFNADSLRYWAASTKLGEDMPYMEQELVAGNKTVNKLWNASRFVIMNLDNDFTTDNYEVMDKWILSKYNKIVGLVTDSLEIYEYSKAKKELDNFFWNTFCDYYLEIVKDRLYNADSRGLDAKKSAQQTLHTILLGIIKMWAPFMPHITEEIYQAYFINYEKINSVHLTRFPENNSKLHDSNSEIIGDLFVEILAQVRKLKSEKQISLGKDIETLTITLPAESHKLLSECLLDLKAACRAGNIIIKSGDLISVTF